jgi:hypothetical protein
VKECESFILDSQGDSSSGPPTKKLKKTAGAKFRQTDLSQVIPFDASKRESRPCPWCDHHITMALETTEEVDLQNKAIQLQFEQNIKDWKSGGKKGAKPRCAKTKSQEIACWCSQQYCFNHDDCELGVPAVVPPFSDPQSRECHAMSSIATL